MGQDLIVSNGMVEALQRQSPIEGAPGQRHFFGDLVNRPFHPDTYRLFETGRFPNLALAEIHRGYYALWDTQK